jgi:flagellin-like protein
MRNILESRKGISPILATLLLIVIAVAAVIVTYAWVMTFTGSTTNQAGAVLTVENVRFYDDGDSVDITLRNSGIAAATVDTVYMGLTASSLESQSASMGIVEAGSTLTITISDNSIWADGTTYYFNIGTEEGLSIPFSREA